MAAKNDPSISCYIIAFIKGGDVSEAETIEFQFMPNTITDMKSAVYNDTIPIARSSPVKSYSHSGARTISFALEFFANPEAGRTDMTPKIIKGKIDLLRALTMPDYSGMKLKPPPQCIVRIGDQVSFLGLCKSVNVTYDNSSPWDLDPKVYAHHAIVSLTFEESLDIPLSFDEVANPEDDNNNSTTQGTK